MRSHKLSYGAVSLLLSCLPAFAKQYEANQYDVSLALSPAGILHVTETVEFHFGGGSFRYVYRTLATTETDGIDEVQAWFDGVECPRGAGSGQVEIRGSSPVRVVWHFGPSRNEVHVFRLSYRVKGAIRKLEDADALVWRALPPDREYRIAASRISLEYPEDIKLAGPPSIRRIAAPFVTGPGSATIELRDVKAGFPAIVAVRFASDSLARVAPAWQISGQRRSGDFEGGLRDGAIGAAALGIAAILAILWMRREQPQRSEPPASMLFQPPDDMTPSLAAYLVGSHGGMGALLLELARRGVLRITEIPRRRWAGRRDYQVDLGGDIAGLAPHEQSFVGLLFRGSARSARLSQCAPRAAGAWPRIAAVMREELRAAGLFDTERARSRRRLMSASAIALFLGFACLLAGLILHKDPDGARLSGILVALGIGAAASAFIVLIVAASLSRLTDRGEALKARWKSFARYLREVSEARRETDWGTEFERFLPYAAAFGIAGAWTRRYQSAGGLLPPWFASVGGEDGDAAFVSFIGASDSGAMAGGDSGAGAAAGASGGGGSGAG